MIGTRLATYAVGGIALLGGGTVAADQAQNPYTDKGATYEMPVAADIPQSDHIEIAKAVPSITLSRWNDEGRLTIKANLPGTGSTSRGDRPLFSKRIEFTKGAVTAFVEPAASTSQFNIDFELAQKPASNVFNYTFTGAEDFNFYYQSALSLKDAPLAASCTDTLCVDKEGNHVIERPENVVGSYAVYSKDKRDHHAGSTNYGTGKVAHIYRPKATDADGNETWATLAYDSGVLSVTVPQKFLDTATYPVIVDPTFGYTTMGGTNGANYCASFTLGNAAAASTYSASSGDTVTSFTFGGVVLNGDAGTKTLLIALYTYTGGLPGSIVGSSASASFSGSTPTFYTTGAISQALTGGTSYTLVCSSSTDSNTSLMFDSLTNGAALDFNPNFHSPFTSGIALSWLLTMYATYTTGGGASPATNPSDTVLFE